MWCWQLTSHIFLRYFYIFVHKLPFYIRFFYNYARLQKNIVTSAKKKALYPLFWKCSGHEHMFGRNLLLWCWCEVKQKIKFFNSPQYTGKYSNSKSKNNETGVAVSITNQWSNASLYIRLFTHFRFTLPYTSKDNHNPQYERTQIKMKSPGPSVFGNETIKPLTYAEELDCFPNIRWIQDLFYCTLILFDNLVSSMGHPVSPNWFPFTRLRNTN